MKTKPSIKILVAYHKKATLLKNDVLVPIHLGRTLQDTEHKDGKYSQKELTWLYENMIGDDTGDNISYMNRNINEMTAIYWAWKNYDKLGNPDYIGLAHYRSVLLMTYMPRYNKQTLLESLGYNYDLFNQLRGNIDFVCGQFYSRGYSVYTDWVNMTKCTEDREVRYLDFVTDYIKNHYKDVSSTFIEFLQQDNIGGQKNIFIMRKELFFNYCEFMFNIIFAMKKHFNNEGINNGNCRAIGKMAEFLSSFYFYYLASLNLKYKTFPIVNVPLFERDDNLIKDIFNYRKMYFELYKCELLYNLTFGKIKNHYKNKRLNLKYRIENVINCKKNVLN